MKIGFILDSGEFGGAERQAYLLGRELNNSGCLIQFFYLKKNNSSHLDHLLEKEGIECHDLKFTFTSTHHTRFFHCLQLAIRLRKYDLDILMPYTIRPNVNINFAWQLTGVKKSFWNQRDIGFGFGEKYRDRILWFSLKNTSGFISNSEGGLEFLQSYLPSNKPSVVIKNGVESIDSSENENLKQQLSIDQSDFVVLMLANFTRYKDHITLLKAWKKLELTNAKLLLAGLHGEAYSTIIDFMKTNELMDNVLLPGSMNGRSAIQIADLCVLSSEKEGLSNSILESMAYSKAVIATKNSGNLEALGIDYPYLFEFSNFKQLANMIKKLKENYDERINVGVNNLKRLQSNFSLEVLVNETLTFLNKV